MPEPLPTPSPTPGESAKGEYRLGERLGVIASNAGLAVGVLYAVGALRLLADLRGAGVATGEAFPLIPVEDHLSRGLQILFSRTGLVLAFLVIASTFVYEELAERREAKAAGTGAGGAGWGASLGVRAPAAVPGPAGRCVPGAARLAARSSSGSSSSR